MRDKASVLFAGIALALGMAGVSFAVSAADSERAKGGVLRCGGTSSLRLGGTEAQFTAWDLRNLSSTTPITIERVTFFAATGTVLFDSSLSGLPPFNAGVPVGAAYNNNILGPNQTTGLTSLDVVALSNLPPTLLPLQVEFVWSATARVPPLDVRTIRLSRERNPTTFALGADRARGDFNCVPIG
jgi:hypothetical protein